MVIIIDVSISPERRISWHLIHCSCAFYTELELEVVGYILLTFTLTHINIITFSIEITIHEKKNSQLSFNNLSISSNRVIFGFLGFFLI